MFGSVLQLPWTPAKVTGLHKGQEELLYSLFFIAVFMFLSESIYLEERSSTLQSKKQLFLILASGQQGGSQGYTFFQTHLSLLYYWSNRSCGLWAGLPWEDDNTIGRVSNLERLLGLQ